MAVALVQSENERAWNCSEHMKQELQRRGAFLWKECQAVLHIPPIHADLDPPPPLSASALSQAMTSDRSGTDSTFTTTFVLTAYADMKMAFSILNPCKSVAGEVYLG